MTTLTKLIKEYKLDWVNPNIKDGVFPVPDTINTDFKLYHFNRYISSEDAIKEIDKDGYKPATIYELLSWKEWNGHDTVIALGSVCRVFGGRRVACLDRYDSGRGLSLFWFDDDWRGHYRFLAVRNLSSKTKELGTGNSGALTLEQRIEKIEEWIEKGKYLSPPLP